MRKLNDIKAMFRTDTAESRLFLNKAEEFGLDVDLLGREVKSKVTGETYYVNGMRKSKIGYVICLSYKINDISEHVYMFGVRDFKKVFQLKE